MSVEIVFETHSISTDNESGIATGWLDGRLSETSRENARELGERRRRDKISAVFTSDSGRAVETAESPSTDRAFRFTATGACASATTAS